MIVVISVCVLENMNLSPMDLRINSDDEGPGEILRRKKSLKSIRNLKIKINPGKVAELVLTVIGCSLKFLRTTYVVAYLIKMRHI